MRSPGATRPPGFTADRGISLLELVLAFGLLGLAILALIAMFVSGLKLSNQARRVAVATEIGRQVMEETKARKKTLGFAYLPAGTYTFDGRKSDPLVGPPYFPPPPYPATNLNHQEYFVVVHGEEPSVDKLKRFRVDVYWTDTAHVSLETRFTP